MKEKLRQKLRKWLGIENNDNHIEAIENLILHKESKLLGYAVLKRHLSRPDKPLLYFAGKEIEQD